MQEHPHLSTTNGIGGLRQRSHPTESGSGVSGGRSVAGDAVRPEELGALDLRLGAELLADGRVYAGRTTEADVDLLVDVVRVTGARLGAAAAV
jgi:hypothetical protein